MEARYIDPTSSGRRQLVIVLASYLALLGLLVWLSSYFGHRFEALLDQVKGATAGNEEVFFAEIRQLQFEVAVVRFIAFLAIAAPIIAITRALQVARQWPIPGFPVAFRSRVRSEPRYIRAAVVGGYLSGAMCLFSGLLGFYAWFLLRSAT